MPPLAALNERTKSSRLGRSCIAGLGWPCRDRQVWRLKTG